MEGILRVIRPILRWASGHGMSEGLDKVKRDCCSMVRGMCSKRRVPRVFHLDSDRRRKLEHWSGIRARKCAHNEILAQRRSEDCIFQIRGFFFLRKGCQRSSRICFLFCETGETVADPFPLVLFGSWDGNYGRMSNESGMRGKKICTAREEKLC